MRNFHKAGLPSDKPEGQEEPFTLPSLKVDLVWGGLFEDLGPILGVLGVMVSTI